MKMRIGAGLLIILCLLTVGVINVLAQDSGSSPVAAQGGDPNSMVMRKVEAAAAQTATTFWTDAQMQAAKPLVLRLPVTASEMPQTEMQGQATGAPLLVPGGLPGGSNVSSSLQAEELTAEEVIVTEGEAGGNGDIAGADAPLAGDATTGYSYPPPFTRYSVNKHLAMWTDYPYSAIGKLYFQIPGSASPSYCSGAVAVRRAVWTAGHCLFTKGKGWHYNVVFVPANRDGAQPWGVFAVTEMAVLNGWMDGSWAYDIGMVITADHGLNKISDLTGWFGAQFNTGATRQFHAFGYPFAFDAGKYTYACAASTSRRDPRTGPDPIGIGCDMGNGSSGGPWVTVFQPYEAGSVNYVNGLTSYGYVSKPKEMFAAYFGDGALRLYNWGVTR